MPLAPSQSESFWTTSDKSFIKIYQGDVLSVLKKLPGRSVQCCVTSPPYWGLRSYLKDDHEHKHLELGSELIPDCLGWARGVNCAEQDWENACYICRMVLVFRELRRVLRDDGTFWLNMGDTYGHGTANGGVFERGRKYNGNPEHSAGEQRWAEGHQYDIKTQTGLKPGNLLGMPWRLALALQADGWILRSDIPWIKRSPMPESVTNRLAKALEYVFLFAKEQKYYFDMVAIKKVSGDKQGRVTSGEGHSYSIQEGRLLNSNDKEYGCPPGGRNFRNADLWYQSVDTPHGLTGIDEELVGLDIVSEAYPGAHFATFPSKLIEPLIKAGTSEKGCCSVCHSPQSRVVEKKVLTRNEPNSIAEIKTLGWKPTCNCGGSIVPCVVLDPFLGSGTTSCVAASLGRASIGIELSVEYLRNNAIPRIEGSLIERPAMSHLIPRPKQTAFTGGKRTGKLTTTIGS